MKDSTGKAIEDARANMYLKVKGISPSEIGEELCRIMIVVIAGGILQYLEDYQNEFLSTITVSDLDLNIQMGKKTEGQCLNAEGAIQGVATIVNTQMKTSAQ